jgi:hypothetical protein
VPNVYALYVLTRAPRCPRAIANAQVPARPHPPRAGGGGGGEEEAWQAFALKVNTAILGHPIVKNNVYTTWFKHGHASNAEARDLTIQFSVFSNLFLEAQLSKVINAGSLDEMREVCARA